MTDRGRATIQWTRLETTLGPALVAVSEKGVCRLAFGEGEADVPNHFPGARIAPANNDCEALLARVRAAIERPSPEALSIPLDGAGTPFQRAVWDELRRIPLGETRTYGEIAAALGKPGASRAVGAANAANRIAILIPCHRVVAAGGKLGGYAYGSALKAEILRRERQAASGMASD